jgi:GNAT superfamily N-acetyltransferase
MFAEIPEWNDVSIANCHTLIPMPFSDLTLSRRLERAEGFACCQYAETRISQFPNSGAAWIECGGAVAVFDGVDSPCTQTFGLGIFEELTESTLDTIEAFFRIHSAPVQHEVSPFAGVDALRLLCKRGYAPIELSSVLYRPVEPPAQPATLAESTVSVRITGPDEANLWSRISAKGWSHDHPELMDVMLNFGALTAAREHTVCFLAEADDQPGAAGVLCIHDGVALLGGSSTVPEMRRRGMQSALLEARMSYAYQIGCDLAMMVAWPGTDSQRNAERKGFQIAYTRTKWQLQAHTESN